MTITTQYGIFSRIDVLDDQRPGTIDVRWAEKALSHRRPIHQAYAVARPPQRPPRQALRRLLAAFVIAACLVVAIAIAPGATSPAPRRTPTAATVTSRPGSVSLPNAKSFGVSGLFECTLAPSTRHDALERLALPPVPSCLGIPSNAAEGRATRAQMG
jgi:hypothetical protein